MVIIATYLCVRFPYQVAMLRQLNPLALRTGRGGSGVRVAGKR